MPSSSSSPVVLADTNVISELTRTSPNSCVARWAQAHMRIAISAITLEELVFGFGNRHRPDIERKWLAIEGNLIDVLSVTGEIASRAGALRAEHRRAGRTRGQADMMIAATAIH